MFIDLSLHYKKLDYFNTYWEELYLSSMSDAACVIRDYCMEQLTVNPLILLKFMMHRNWLRDLVPTGSSQVFSQILPV